MPLTQLASRVCRPTVVTAVLASFLAACSSPSGARRSQSFLAQSLQPCNQTDSTVSCCLKKYPGQYERCGADVPVTPPQKPNRLPPPGTELPEEAEPRIPTQKERERWRDIFELHYVKCVDVGGARIPGRVEKETQCRACYAACMRYGFWPYKANDKRCLGE